MIFRGQNFCRILKENVILKELKDFQICIYQKEVFQVRNSFKDSTTFYVFQGLLLKMPTQFKSGHNDKIFCNYTKPNHIFNYYAIWSVSEHKLSFNQWFPFDINKQLVQNYACKLIQSCLRNKSSNFAWRLSKSTQSW